MLSIRIAEVDVIRVGLEILGNSSLEYIASKKSARRHDHILEGQHWSLPVVLAFFFFRYFSKSTERKWLLNSESSTDGWW